MKTPPMLQRLAAHWVYGGFLAGTLILALVPVLTSGWTAALAWVFLHLPMYMLHQYEEHDRDRFRLAFNKSVGRGREVLTPMAVFVINVPGVWGVIAVSICLAATVQVGWGLVAVYLALVNAVMHVGQAVVLRRYNPGLATGLALFLPVTITTLLEIQAAGGGYLGAHAVGLGVAVAIHAAILAYVRYRGSVLEAVAATVSRPAPAEV